jgi:hypothetical protein
MNAVEIEEGISALAEQAFDSVEFPFAFLQAFGNKETTIKKLRAGASNKSDLGGVLQTSNIHIAVASPGKVTATLAALKASPATARAKAKFVLATDGDTFEAEDLTSGETVACAYADFPNHFGFFLQLAGITTVKQVRESSFDIRATGRLNRRPVRSGRRGYPQNQTRQGSGKSSGRAAAHPRPLRGRVAGFLSDDRQAILPCRARPDGPVRAADDLRRRRAALFPWFSFWRQNPLANERLSLFVTLVDEILMQDPDLENARFEILDFSCPGPKIGRRLRVIDSRDIPRIDDTRKAEMLEKFAEGYFRALAELAGTPPPPSGDRPDDRATDPNQPSLFD